MHGGEIKRFKHLRVAATAVLPVSGGQGPGGKVLGRKPCEIDWGLVDAPLIQGKSRRTIALTPGIPWESFQPRTRPKPSVLNAEHVSWAGCQTQGLSRGAGRRLPAPAAAPRRR